MKKLLPYLLCLFFSISCFSQIGIIENFNAGLPTGWNGVVPFGDDPAACEGKSLRDELYQYSSTSVVTSPNIVGQSNGTDLTISLDYKILDYSFFGPGDPTQPGWGQFTIQYTTDGGGQYSDWIDVGTVNDDNHIVSPDCATITYTVDGANLPSGSDFRLRIYTVWEAGDYFMYFDNISATQITSSPPNCDAALTTPIDGAVNVPIETSISWNQATGIPTGYIVSIGSAPGATDIADQVDVGMVTSYTIPGNLDYNTTYYVSVTPYNANGSASTTHCTETSFTTEADPHTYFDCEDGPINTVFCYENESPEEYIYTSNDGSSLQLVINAGQVQPYSDPFIILDSDGSELYNGAGINDNGDLSGLVFQSSGDQITVQVLPNIFQDCATDGNTPIDLSVFCKTCDMPETSYSVISDCENGDQFNIEIEITNMGSASSLAIEDNQGNPSETILATGATIFGPYANGTEVSFSIENEADSNCSLISPLYTQLYCPPENDECGNSIVVDVNSDDNCTLTTPGTIQGATPSAETNPCSETGQNNDVWFEFTATSTAHYIQLLNITGQSWDIYYGIFEGNDCGNLTEINCSSGSVPSYIYNLTIGQTYKIRVYSYSSDPQQSSTFDVCVSTPPPPPENDDCIDAVMVPVNEDGTCTQTVTGELQWATSNNPTEESNCFDSTTIQNDIWFKFTATSNEHVISLLNIVDNASWSLLYEIYEGDECDGLEFFDCPEEAYQEVNMVSGLTIGNTYYIRVFSNGADPSGSTSFDVCVSTLSPNDIITTSADAYTADELVRDVLIGHPCAEISNVTSSTGLDYGSDANGIGYFEANGSDFPIESGIILSNGEIANAPGPETGYQTMDANGVWLGDEDFDNALPSGQASINASSIEFDFVPYIDEISFDFLFASDEYGPQQCVLSDGFAFLLTDSAGNTQNLAVVPGTGDPISNTTINNEAYTPYPGCTSTNPEYFDTFYGEGGEAPITAPINYRGNTVVMTAHANVIAGEQYHIKLVVADRMSSGIDSAVFLAENSFDLGEVNEITLGEDISVENGNITCEGTPITLDTGIENTEDAAIEWYKDSELIPGETGPSLEVNEAGEYAVSVILFGQCALSDVVNVDFFQPIDTELGDNESICNQNEVTLDATPINASNFAQIAYTWYLDGNELTAETSATLSTDQPGTYTVEVSGFIIDNDGNPTATLCEGTDEIELTVSGFTIDLGADQNLCDHANYTITSTITGADASTATYTWEDSDGVISGETSSTLIVTESGTYTVTADIDGCTASDDISVQLNQSPLIDLGEDMETCDLATLTIDATPSNFDETETTFTWIYEGTPIPETGAIVSPSTYGYGTYEVTAYADDPDCITTASITISERDDIAATLTANQATTQELWFCSEVGNEIPIYQLVLTAALNNAGNSNGESYTWYKNGNLVADENTASYTITYNDEGTYNDTFEVVISVGGCSANTTIETHVSILPYENGCAITRGLSPDSSPGQNDCMDLTFLNDRSGIKSFKLYNRYGRLVYEKSNYTNSFCGQGNNGEKLPTGTYYYVLEFLKKDPVFGQVKKDWVYINQKTN